MKYFVLSLLLLANVQLFGQFDGSLKSNIGVAVGMMNYSGYMTNKPFTLSQAKPNVELMYRYDVTDQFHVRATLAAGSLARDNGTSFYINGSNRAGSFKTGIFDLDILPEYDFLDLRTHSFSPYLFMGGGYYSLFSYERNGVEYNKPNNNGFNFRGGLGFKYALNPAVQLFVEGSRREFSKSIDFYERPNSPSRYYSIMAGITYRLGAGGGNELW